MRLSALMCCLPLLALTGCPDGIGAFSITEESAEAIVMGAATPIDLPINIFPPLQLDIDLESELAAQNAGPASGVFLTGLQTVITESSQPEGDADDFDFVESVEVFIESRQEDSSLRQRKIAEITSVPDGQTTLDFMVEEDVDLKPYVEEGARLITKGSGEIPPDDTSLKAIVTLRITLL